MKLERKHGWLLLAVAVWNVIIWLTFAKNLSAAHASGEDHPTGYWVAHTVLIVYLSRTNNTKAVATFIYERMGVRSCHSSCRRRIRVTTTPRCDRWLMRTRRTICRRC